MRPHGPVLQASQYPAGRRQPTLRIAPDMDRPLAHAHAFPATRGRGEDGAFELMFES